MRTGFPCNESRFFPVGIDLQGFPVSYTGFGFAVNVFPYAIIRTLMGVSILEFCWSSLLAVARIEENLRFFCNYDGDIRIPERIAFLLL